MRDRVVQAAAKLVWNRSSKPTPRLLLPSPERSAHRALEAIRVGVNGGRTWVVDADIASFFDSIQPEVLRSALRSGSAFGDGEAADGVVTGRDLDRGDLDPSRDRDRSGRGDQSVDGDVVLPGLIRRWQQDHRRLAEIIRFADDLVILSPTRNGPRRRSRCLPAY